MKPKSLATLAAAAAAIVVVAVVLASGGSAKTRLPQVAGGSAVNVRHTALGETLVDANGRTLYLFEGDKRDLSTLSAAGRAIWPPFTSSGMVNAEGLAQGAKLGTTPGGHQAGDI